MPSASERAVDTIWGYSRLPVLHHSVGDSMMSQQVLKPHNPSSLLAPKGQVARGFTGGHRHARVARTLINSSKASKGGSSDENVVLSSGMLTADHSNTIRDFALMDFGFCLKTSR